MTGETLGSIILTIIVLAIVVAVIVYLMHWLYRRSSKETAFVRTGLGGQKVVINGGAFVLPIVHEITPVNMNTLRLEVRRGRDSALITRNRMRVDVVAEFYARVQPVPGSGPGVDEEFRSRLTERFFRAPGSEGVAGTGLGLTLVQAIVNAHRGLLEFHDVDGDFAVIVRLPLSGE